jgi:hypothetical protein
MRKDAIAARVQLADDSTGQSGTYMCQLSADGNFQMILA